MILDQICKPNDIHRIPLEDFPALAAEIRQFLVRSVSKTGGHLASNLGVVELTLALHNVLHFPEDKLIWDVGHQAYTHKILTGRKEDFATLRKEGGLSGFPKRGESPCDAFDTGHSSNSISAGLGYVRARDLLGERYRVVSVIGDGALTGGMAFEALNNAAGLDKNFIIVLNDNNMSIARNVGGLSTYLSALRTAQGYADMKLRVEKKLQTIPRVGTVMVDTARRTKSSLKQLFIPSMLFEDMGLTYLGPVDGHDVRLLMKTLNEAKRVDGPVIVHVLTKKGKGYEPAQLYPERFHGTGPFDILTGSLLSAGSGPTYTDIFSKAVCAAARENPRVCAITAAMPEGTGLGAFGREFEKRFFDVGIAEGHAVTFAAGLALGGMIPVVAVYSSFLQRGFDQLLQDVCMQNLHVIFAIDRAGLVGADGETHQGDFDLSYLGMMPNMTIMAPACAQDLEEMTKSAIRLAGPVAIRYSRETAWMPKQWETLPGEDLRSQVLHRGSRVAILAVGSMVQVCEAVCRRLEADGLHPTLVNVRIVKPLDVRLLEELAKDHERFLTVEENAGCGGFGGRVCTYMAGFHPQFLVETAAICDQFIPQGTIPSLRERIGLGEQALYGRIRKFYEETT